MTEETITAQPQAQWHRVLQTRRELLGLTRTWAHLLTGLSPRTIRRAEEDSDWSPTAETIATLTHMWGEGWREAGMHVVNPEEEHTAAMEHAARRLGELTYPSARRRQAIQGTADTVTLALFGEPLPYLLLAGLLRDQEPSTTQPVSDALSWEDERELGFPERRYGEIVQRSGGVLQALARAATAYAAVACLPEPTPWEAARRISVVWDRLLECQEDDLADLWQRLNLADAKAEVLLHRTGWGALCALVEGKPLTAGQARYVELFGEHRPRLARLLWHALDVGEDDPQWERLAQQWVRDRPHGAGEDEQPITPAPFDACLDWVSTALLPLCVQEMQACPPADDLDGEEGARSHFVQDLLGFNPSDVDLNEIVAEARRQILTRVQTAAKWAAIEAGTGPRGWRHFLRKVVLVCRGGEDQRGKRIPGAGLSPRMLAQRLDLHGLFDAACHRRTREHALWTAVTAWIAHPFGPPPSDDASRLALAGLSLLPEPPIAEKVLLDPEEADHVVAALAPRFLDPPTADRLKRLVLGVIKAWKGPLPLFALEKQRRAELAHGTHAALRGQGEQSTAGKLARALLQTLPRPVGTGVALAECEAQRRVTLGLPYFFPVRRAHSDRLAAARSVVTRALLQARA